MEQKKVYAAISAVARDMAEVGISKDRENRQQGFSFRREKNHYQPGRSVEDSDT